MPSKVLIGVSYVDTATITSAVFVGGGSLTLVAGTNVTGTGMKTAIYQGTAAGGETGVTFTTSGAVRLNLQVIEVANVGAVESVQTGTGTTSPTGLDDNLIPITPDNLLIAVIAWDADVYQSISDWTQLGNGTGGAAVYQQMFYWIQTAATDRNIAVVFDAGESGVPYAISGAAFGKA